MPRPQPGLIDKVNYIVRFIEDPCDAPWVVYLETAIPPAGRLLLSWFSFGLDDLIRGYFRPKGLRSGRHGRGGRRGGKPRTRLGRFIARIPGLGDDVGNFIGKRLPGAKAARGRQVSDGVKHLWIIDNRLQQLLLWWLIVDLVTTFLYEWASALQESEICKRSRSESMVADGLGGGVAGIQDWVALEVPNVLRTTPNIDWLVSTATLPAGSWTVVVALQLENTGAFPQEQRTRLIRPDVAGDVVAETSKPGIFPGQEAEHVLVYDFEGPGQVTAEMWVDQSFAIGTGSNAYVTGTLPL